MKWYAFQLTPEDGLFTGISVAVFCCARKIIDTEEFTKIVSYDLCVKRMLTLPLPPLCWVLLLLLGFVVILK